MKGGWSILAIGVLLGASATSASPQPLSEHVLEANGEVVRYSIRALPPDASIVAPDASIAPSSALDTAKLLNRYLTAGNIEEAAMLSNSPRRRFEVLSDYKGSVGDDGFRQVFTEYFSPGNRVVAEVGIGEHRLLVWHLRDPDRYAGQYYVRVEDRVLIDDVPSETRTQLRRILEAIRSGRLALPLS